MARISFRTCLETTLDVLRRWYERMLTADARVAALEATNANLQGEIWTHQALPPPAIPGAHEIAMLHSELFRCREHLAELETRDAQWEAAFVKLAGVVLEDNGTCPVVGTDDQLNEWAAHCQQVEGRCACARAWADAPEPLNPQEE